jgi:hypothetical protein
MVAVSHIKSVTIADFTGTVTVFNSLGSTVTANATDIVRPSDWDSVHNYNLTITGNTSGSSTIGGATNFILAGGSNVTLSMNTAASIATISISAGGGILSRYTDWGGGFENSASSNITNNSLSIKGFLIYEDLSFSRVDLLGSLSIASSATANTYAMAVSSVMVPYTRNASTLSPIVGASGTTTFSGASNTASFNSLTGPRLFSFPLSTKLSAGEYFAGFQFSTNSSATGTATTSGMTLGVAFGTNALTSATEWRDIGSTNVASTNIVFGGVFSTNISNTTQTLALSAITQTGTAGVRAGVPLIFRNW